MKKYIHFLLALALSIVLLWGCKSSPAQKTRAAASAPSSQAAEQGEEQRAGETALQLALLHVNDTHSKLEPSQVKFIVYLSNTLGPKPVYLELGGFPQVWAAAEQLRQKNPSTLFLHAGDAFQGTLFFTQFEGKADVDFLNAMGIDAMVMGNHEFDKGPLVLRSFIDLARFSVLSANLDYGLEPELAGSSIRPYVIESFGGSRVAVFGLTTPETPYISSPGENIRFEDPATTLLKYVGEVESKGVNKVVVLSHLGYQEDLLLAASVRGVDVIVGGHSHTLLGSFSDLGLQSFGKYPTAVEDPAGDTVLVATAWEWAKVLGELEVNFDENGRVTGWSGSPRLVAGDSWVRIYDLPGSDGKPVRVQFTRAAGAEKGTSARTWDVLEYDGNEYSTVPSEEQRRVYLEIIEKLMARLETDPRFFFTEPKPEGVEKLKTYSAGVDALKKQVVAQAAEELRRGNNQGPGPLIAESMLLKTGAQIAVMNPGGVRTNLNPGPVTVAQIYELQPFGNTLVTLDIPGGDVVKVLEDMCDFTISRYEKYPGAAFVYVAGLRFILFVNAPKGERVRNVRVKNDEGVYEPLENDRTYKVVVNSFMASGGDKNDTLKAAAKKNDTGFIDSEATLEYLKGKSLVNKGEERIRQVF